MEFVLSNENVMHENLIVYEVNLDIRKDIYEKHKEWLMQHIDEMVKKNNFIKANIYHQINMDPTNDSFMMRHRLTARYYIKTYAELKSYLEDRAKAMRNQVMEKLGEHYTVFRRVFELKQEIQNN